MYVQHFGLEHEPFSIAPDPRYLYLSERHREALAHLTYGLGAGGGVVLLTGEIGAGKTTVCRCFLEQVPANCQVAYIFNPKLTVLELLASVCDEFAVPISVAAGPRAAAPSVKTYLDPLNRFLLEAHGAGLNCVLVIDEAQLLSADVLEQLRLLTNLETGDRKLLQIILVGQPELRTMLDQPGLEQLAQRVIARYHLGALDRADTGHYLQHRMVRAGLQGSSPLGPELLPMIHRFSAGVPRRINRLCDRALLGAFAQGRATVDVATLRRAAAEVEGGERRSAIVLSPDRADWQRFAAGTVAGALLVGSVWLLWAPPSARPPPLAAAEAVNLQVARGSIELPAAPIAPPAEPAPAPRAEARVIDSAELRQWLAAPARDDGSAVWRELAALWQVELAEGEPCIAAARQQLGCHQDDGGVALLRQLGRPALLKLQPASGAPVPVLLLGIDARAATLQIGAEARRLSLLDLAALWNGVFVTFWRVPDPLLQPLPGDGSEPLAPWLAQRLAIVDGARSDGDGRRIDAALRARLVGFQRAQGLDADGVPGPMTLMALNRATGVDEPRLLTRGDND